jgi:hypothetical protein
MTIQRKSLSFPVFPALSEAAVNADLASERVLMLPMGTNFALSFVLHPGSVVEAEP